MNVFISYRRDDSRAWTERLYDRLEARYGPGAIFKDVGTIPAASKFPKEIEEGIARSHILLAIIGRNWCGQVPQGGLRRIDDPSDFVRIEIESALSRGIYLIPVLVDGATMPAPPALPSSLTEFCQLNSVLLRHDPDFEGDVENIARLMAKRMLFDIAQELECQKLPGNSHNGIPDRMNFLDEGISRDQLNYDFIIKRAQMELTNATQPAGSGFIQSMTDNGHALGLRKEAADPHIGLGTAYFHLAMVNLVKVGRYRIHAPGKMGKHPVTGMLGMSPPDLELTLDYPTAEYFKLALSEFLEGQRLRQGFGKIGKSMNFYFAPADVSARIKSTRILLGMEPMVEPDQFIVQTFTTSLMRFDAAAFSKVFEIVGYDDDKAPKGSEPQNTSNGELEPRPTAGSKERKDGKRRGWLSRIFRLP